MKTYPMFAPVEDRACLVVGGGAVGARKVEDLLTAGARVTVVSRELTPELLKWSGQGKIQVIRGDFIPAHLDEHDPGGGGHGRPPGQPGGQRRSKESGPFRQYCARPGTVHLHRAGPGAPGAPHHHGQHRRVLPGLGAPGAKELEERFGPEYGRFLRVLQAVRARVLARRRAHPDNLHLFQRLLPVPEEALAREDRARALAALEETLGGILAPEDLAAALDEAWEEEDEGR